MQRSEIKLDRNVLGEQKGRFPTAYWATIKEELLKLSEESKGWEFWSIAEAVYNTHVYVSTTKACISLITTHNVVYGKYK